MEAVIDSWIWIPVAFAVYGATTIFAQYVENDYRRMFELEKVTLFNRLPSILVGALALAILAYLSHDNVPYVSLVPIAGGVAVLRGVYLVDRILLLIPDRFQIAGSLAGILFVASFIASGEDSMQVMTEALFALTMVGLLWLMSYIYFKIRGTIGFGLGDVKLLGWLSLFCGKRMPNLILIAIFIGIGHLLVMTIYNSLKEKKLRLPHGQEAFAFGPSIVIAAFIEAAFFYA